MGSNNAPPPPPTLTFFHFLNIVQYLFVHCTIPSILGSHPPYPTSPPTPNIAFTSTLTPPNQTPPKPPDPPPPKKKKKKKNFGVNFPKTFNSSFTSTLTPHKPDQTPLDPPPPFFGEFSQKLQFFYHTHPDPPTRPLPPTPQIILFLNFHKNFHSSFTSTLTHPPTRPPPPPDPAPTRPPPPQFFFNFHKTSILRSHPTPSIAFTSTLTPQTRPPRNTHPHPPKKKLFLCEFSQKLQFVVHIHPDPTPRTPSPDPPPIFFFANFPKNFNSSITSTLTPPPDPSPRPPKLFFF